MVQILPKLLMCILLATEVTYALRSEEDALLGARCRATCLDHFAPQATSVQECEKDSNCYMCWDMCELLLVDTFSWSPVCESEQSHLCTEGCQTACKMIFSLPYSEPKVVSTNWKLPQLSLNHDGPITIVSWGAPVVLRTRHNHSSAPRTSIVYVVLLKDTDSNDWYATSVSIEQEVVLQGNPNHLRLVAVTSNGILVEETPEKHLTSVDHQLEDLQPKVTVSKMDKAINANLILDFTQASQVGELWVEWERVSCQTETERECDLPESLSSLVLDTKDLDQIISITMLELTYNSHYSMDIYSVRTDQVYNIIFKTPYCPHPDATMKQCEISEEKDPKISHNDLYVASGLTVVLFFVLLLIIVVAAYHFSVCDKNCSFTKYNNQELQPKSGDSCVLNIQ